MAGHDVARVSGYYNHERINTIYYFEGFHGPSNLHLHRRSRKVLLHHLTVFLTTRILIKATIITYHRYQSTVEDSLIAVVIRYLITAAFVLMLSY